MNDLLGSHLIEPERLRADDFFGTITARGQALLSMIHAATGRPISGPEVAEVFGVQTDEEEELDEFAEAAA
jgi:hypothetical protein